MANNTIKTTGIILKISDTPSKDKLVKFITPLGVLSAFMTPKRNAGKKNYTTDLFMFGEIVFFKTDSGNLLLNSFVPMEHFYKIREDITSLATASYFSSLVLNLANDIDLDYSLLLKLIYNSFSSIVDKVDLKIIKAVFELKYAQFMGVEPCLMADEKAEKYYFDLQDGRLYLQEQARSVFVRRSTVLSVYKILKLSVDDTALFDFEEDLALFNLCESYILFHIDKQLDTLEFLKGVI